MTVHCSCRRPRCRRRARTADSSPSRRVTRRHALRPAQRHPGRDPPAAVSRRLEGDLGTPQDERHATYCCTRVSDDEAGGLVGVHPRHRRARSRRRAPLPGRVHLRGLDRVSIVEAAPSPHGKVFVGAVPGRVVGWSAAEGWSDVLTGDGVLRVTRVRLGGVEQAAAGVLKSSHLTLGLRSIDLLGRIESLTARIAELTAQTTEP